jgi:hypothetical protein
VVWRRSLWSSVRKRKDCRIPRSRSRHLRLVLQIRRSAPQGLHHPRGQGALGYAHNLPAGDTYLMNVRQLMDRMAMTLAGRVSRTAFRYRHQRCQRRLQQVTRMATAMVTKWGMSNKIGYLYSKKTIKNYTNRSAKRRRRTSIMKSVGSSTKPTNNAKIYSSRRKR